MYEIWSHARLGPMPVFAPTLDAQSADEAPRLRQQFWHAATRDPISS